MSRTTARVLPMFGRILAITLSVDIHECITARQCDESKGSVMKADESQHQEQDKGRCLADI